MSRRLSLFLGVLLVALTLLVYSRALQNGFVRGDDESYVTRNPQVQAGLTPAGVEWAFSLQGHAANWHPLTWISHMLDVSIYGMDPAGHHLTNVLFHAAAAALLFWFLVLATGAAWRSAFVAALFALHPLHVESVAWVAERKDVLSAFFWMLTLVAYAVYARKPGVRRYLAVAGAFALGLLAKPMLVTLPCVLLLLDAWPLGRAHGGAPRWVRLVVEKLPLFALAAASSAITFMVQRSSGAVSPVGELPLAARVGNAVLAYAGYLGKTLVPSGLAAFYPHPGEALPAGHVAVSAAVLVAITALVVWGRRRSYLPMGWLWYLGTLVPVIGIVQVGDQAMADRYTYIPLIGVFVMAVWGVGDLVGSGGTARARTRTLVAGGAGAAILAVLASVTWAQIGVWHDTVSLYGHALAVTGPNYVNENNLAQGLRDQRRYAEAAEHYRAAVALNPGWAEGYSNLANALANQGKYAEAAAQFEKALALKRQDGGGGDETTSIIEYSLGVALVRAGKGDEAASHFRESIRISPEFALPHYELARLLEESGDGAGAIAQYREAIRLSPDYVAAWNNLAVALYRSGDYAGAWEAVAACRARGHEPAAGFVKALSEKLPEPGR